MRAKVAKRRRTTKPEPAAKRRRTAKPEPQGPDLISGLPEEVLTHILSFVPSKSAVQTSVLSRRWELLWAFTTAEEGINLSDRGIIVSDRSFYVRNKCRRKQRFVDFVNRKIEKLRACPSPIRCFSLCLVTSFKNGSDAYPVPQWLSAIQRLAVRKIQVHYFDGLQFYNSPLVLSRSDTLVELELKVSCFLQISSTNFLPNLQTLKFSRIQFVRNISPYSSVIVLNFPKLKRFEVHKCWWLALEDITLKAPRLESFTSLECLFNEYPQFKVFNIKQSCKTAFKICASNLREFRYSGLLLENLTLSNPLAVRDASFDILAINSTNDHKHQAGVRACDFLRQFQKVEVLRLSSRTVEDLVHVNNQVPSTLPVFRSLDSLVLDVSDSSPFEKTLWSLLHKSPVLKSLEFFSGVSRFDKRLLATERVPQSLLSGLESVKIAMLDWNQANRRLAKCLLEHAGSLEKLIICLYMPKGMKRKVKKELQSSPQASNFVAIEVEKSSLKRLIQSRDAFHEPSF